MFLASAPALRWNLQGDLLQRSPWRRQPLEIVKPDPLLRRAQLHGAPPLDSRIGHGRHPTTRLAQRLRGSAAVGRCRRWNSHALLATAVGRADEVTKVQEDRWADAGAAALVAGTAIGGGFLALPYTVAPAGVVPSIVVMAGSWLFLLLQSVIVAELVVKVSLQSSGPTSYAYVARTALGSGGNGAVSLLFVVLMAATLVSQIAKGGQLMGQLLSVPTPLACTALTGALFALTVVQPRRVVVAGSAVLTGGFILALGAMFAMCLPLADWSQLAYQNWSLCWRSVPSILQLFVFCEVVPTICQMLSFDIRRIRRAILAGSLVLLAVEAAWSILGVSLSQVSQNSVLSVDPVARLLSLGGPIASAVFTLAACAVTTTITGTFLALQDFFADESLSRGSSLARFALSVVLPLLAAVSAQDAFYAAIDFAGAYPVALLWGCTPPVMALMLGLDRRLSGKRSLRRTAVLLVLAAMSTAFVASNAAADLGRMLGNAAASARWQRVV
mmetsp:Transcript_40474/g.130036  ORF Transcript_40474/g.130036 Transcript_40474/m.130036 type:complete len:500 (-) Transcript_40474:11-1510(-)